LKTLIIGCGKLGTRLAEILHTAGHQVWALKRHPENLPGFIHPIQGGLECPPAIEWAEFTLIYVIVSPDDRTEKSYKTLYQENIPSLIDQLKNKDLAHQKLIFVSSTHVYSENTGKWVTQNTEVDGYDYRSKALIRAEKSLLDSPLKTQIVRFSGLYDHNAKYLFSQLESGKIDNAGEYTNRIHREDAARFLAYLSHYHGEERIYLASDNQPIQRGELFNWLAQVLGKSKPAFAQNIISGKRCDNQSMRKTGFKLRYGDYKEGYLDIIRNQG